MIGVYNAQRCMLAILRQDPELPTLQPVPAQPAIQFQRHRAPWGCFYMESPAPELTAAELDQMFLAPIFEGFAAGLRNLGLAIARNRAVAADLRRNRPWLLN